MGIIGGIITMFACSIFMVKAFRTSDIALKKLKDKLQNEIIEYSNTASLMIESKELVGALAITDQRVVFGTKSIDNVRKLITNLQLPKIVWESCIFVWVCLIISGSHRVRRLK